MKLVEIAKAENLKLSQGATDAIVSLSGGDMRKVLNILESCSLAHKEIDEKQVYEVTGRPSSEDMEFIFTALNQHKFGEALTEVWQVKTNKSLSLEDVITELHRGIMDTQYHEEAKMFLISRLAEIEYRLAQGSNEKTQVGSLVGAFIEVRTL